MDSTINYIAREDALTYLPHKPLQEFPRGKVIYDHEHPSGCLYMVVTGRVKIATSTADETRSIVRIVSAEDLFGETCMVGPQTGLEIATALDNVHLMAWSATDIEAQISKEPRLGIALAQHLVERCLDLQQRIEGMAFYKTPERVAISLLQLAEALGHTQADGMRRIGSLTHHLIAEFVGTSREIVTFQMNRLRRQGMLRYSRRFIDIDTPALEDSLRTRGIIPPKGYRIAERVRVAG